MGPAVSVDVEIAVKCLPGPFGVHVRGIEACISLEGQNFVRGAFLYKDPVCLS